MESEKLKLESNRVYKFQFELGKRERPVGCRSHSLERVNEMVTYRTVDERRRGELCFSLYCFVLFFRLCFFSFWSGAGVVWNNQYNGWVNCFFTYFGEVYVAVGVMDVTNDVKPHVKMYTWWILIWFVVLCALLS